MFSHSDVIHYQINLTFKDENEFNDIVLDLPFLLASVHSLSFNKEITILNYSQKLKIKNILRQKKKLLSLSLL